MFSSFQSYFASVKPICIDMTTFNLPYMERAHLKKGDILLSIVGTIDSLALVYSENKATCSCKLAILRPKADSNPEVISTFLCGKYGQFQIKKLIRGAVQMGLILEDMDQLYVPLFSNSLEKTIQDSVKAAFNLDNISKQKYAQAERRLLDNLSMSNFIPSSENVMVKNFSESFRSRGRLDAEYYQRKYEDIERLFNKSETVGACCELLDDNFIPKNTVEYKYIELSNIVTNGNIENVETVYGASLPTRARRQVKDGQVIISSIEGSLSNCAIITKEYDMALCSTGFYIIKSDRINSETLLVLFKSHPIQNLMKKDALVPF